MDEHGSTPTSTEDETEGLTCPLSGGSAERLYSRRNLLRMGVGALSLLALAEFGGVSVLYLRSNAAGGEYGGMITAGAVDNFPAGSVTEFPQARFFLIRSAEGGFMAIHSRCTHLGCTVYWEAADQCFYCPCHAAVFDLHGVHGGPPVPRPLDLFAVTMQDGKVMVDTSQPVQRAGFEPSQWVVA